MTKEESIRALTAAGYALVPLCSHNTPHAHRGEPCKSMGKIPTVENWEKTPKGKYDEKTLVQNYGVVLGASDLVVDVDPRRFNDGDRPLPRLINAIGGAVPTFVVRTSGNGLHIYFRKSPDQAVRNALAEYPGIEFKGGPGRQVVGPGSIHATGVVYTVLQGKPQDIPQAAAALITLIAKKEVQLNAGTGEYKDDQATIERYTHLLKSCNPAIQGHGGDDATFRAACAGRDLGLSPSVSFRCLWDVFNVRAQPPWSEDDLRGKVEHAYLYARGAIGNAHPAAHFDKIETPKEEKTAKLSWKLNVKDQPIKCFQNLLNYFTLPALGVQDVFGFNSFTRRVELLKQPPWRLPGEDETIAVQDADLQRMRARLARNHGYDAGKEDIVDAMVDVAHHRRFHPVKDYLDKLKWDGKPRLDGWLIDFLGAEDTDYSRAVGRKTLCAAVARVFQPGIKFDHVLVIEGPQGIGKSGICRILGGEWFGDFKMDVDNKDTVQMMQGKWIVEMAELHATRQTDLDTLKAFLTRQVDEARFAYGRLPGFYPRQGIFIATYNPGPDGTYLKDDTGNRRWWPVKCSGMPPGSRHFNFKGLAAVRDQLFAEAVARWKKGESLTMDTSTLQDAAAAAQAERHGEHPWAERIAGWLEERARNSETNTDFLTAREVWIGAMQGLDARFGRREQLDAAKAMRELGWEPGLRRIGKDRRLARGYCRPMVKKGVEETGEPEEDLAIFGDLI